MERLQEITVCPPLLSIWEVQFLALRFPEAEVALVLQAWAGQVLASRLEGAALAQAQGSIFKLRDAATSIVNDLSMPMPFPYWHCLQVASAEQARVDPDG